jgi:hypothetical protein
MTEKKQLRVLLGILDKMGIKYKDDTTLQTAQSKFEAAIESGKAPSKLSEDELEVLRSLEYEIEGAATAASSEEDEEEEKPKKKPKKDEEDEEEEEEDEEEEEEEDEEKPKKKQKKDEEEEENKKPRIRDWFIEFFRKNRSPTRDELHEAYFETYGKDKENTLHGSIWRAKSDPKFLSGRLLVEKRSYSLVKSEEPEPEEEDDEEEKPKKKKAKKDEEEAPKKVKKSAKDKEEDEDEE